jgi:tripartite motif-containing protein 71
MPRLVALTSALALALATLLVALPASTLPVAAQEGTPPVEAPSLAPENLLCQGRTLPEPQDWYRWAWRWEVLDTYHFAGMPAGASPYAVALDRACNLYVADVAGGQIVKISQEGEILATIPTPSNDVEGVTGPGQGIAVDSQGNVYVSYYAHNVILKFSPDGQLIKTLGECTPAPENSFCDPSQLGLFVGPQGLAIDGTGNAYVMEIGRIQKLNLDGQGLAIWPLAGLIPGELWILGQPALDAAGNLYVPDEFNNRVLKLSPTADNGLIMTQQFGVGPDVSPEPGQFHNPTAVAVNLAGDVYVAERYNWRVQKLSPEGIYLDQWRNCLDGPECLIPANGEAPGQFFNQSGLVVDGQGNLYVADGGNMRVQRLMAFPVLIPEEERPPAP